MQDTIERLRASYPLAVAAATAKTPAQQLNNDPRVIGLLHTGTEMRSASQIVEVMQGAGVMDTAEGYALNRLISMSMLEEDRKFLESIHFGQLMSLTL